VAARSRLRRDILERACADKRDECLAATARARVQDAAAGCQCNRSTADVVCAATVLVRPDCLKVLDGSVSDPSYVPYVMKIRDEQEYCKIRLLSSIALKS
jgi:hypothetical protein